MAEDQVLAHITHAAYTLAAGAAAVVGYVKSTKSWKTRVEELEASVASVMASPSYRWTAEYVERVARQAADRHVVRSSIGGVQRQSDRAADVERQVRTIVDRELESYRTDYEELRTTVEALRRDVAGCASDEDLARLAEGQAGRWEGVQRALGNIEGKIATANDMRELALRQRR